VTLKEVSGDAKADAAPQANADNKQPYQEPLTHG